MCDPITITVLLTSAALQLKQQDDAAKAANEAAKATFESETEQARQEALARENVLNQESQEKAQQLNMERENLAREALRERAAARVGSAESGVGGVSKVRSFLTSEAQIADAESDLSSSERNAEFGLQIGARNITRGRSDRIGAAGNQFDRSTRRRVGLIDVGRSALRVGAKAASLHASKVAARGKQFQQGVGNNPIIGPVQ